LEEEAAARAAVGEWRRGAPLEGGGEAEAAATGLATSREEGAGDWIRKEEEKRMGRK